MILVAGGGPAGTRLAIELACAGLRVTLVDPLLDPQRNAYSSAAIPLDDANKLQIPHACWSTTWQGWQLFDPDGIEHQWWSSDDLGVVLDFGNLRQSLWQQACSAGVELLSGWRVMLKRLHQQQADVVLLGPHGQQECRSVRWLIDATGSRRALLHQAGVPIDKEQDPLLCGYGVEWLIQASDRGSSRWRDRLSFFLGHQWVRYGYGWVFPMAKDQLKVGVCRLPPHDSAGGSAGLQQDLIQLLLRCGLSDCPVLDRHGGVIASTVRRTEPLGAGALIAVGDAASTANLLGGEGIRHALSSAFLLAELLTGQADDDSQHLLNEYQLALKRHLGFRWAISGRLARRTWWGLDSDQADRRMQRLISGLSRTASAHDLCDLLFHYRFERYGLRLIPYLI